MQKDFKKPSVKHNTQCTQYTHHIFPTFTRFAADFSWSLGVCIPGVIGLGVLVGTKPRDQCYQAL